jgi:tRNA pseudouridine38-40 synthase
MPARLKLIIAYNGARLGGWQSQAHHNTIQDQLEGAFHRITGVRLRVHGAGRTDAGVHALAQCAHVDLTERRLSSAQWARALNANLLPAIRVLRCSHVWNNFHARYSAKAKVYRYRIWSAPILPPLEFERAWHVSAPLDLTILQAAAAKFVGTHDFAGFAANRGKPETNTIRTIHSVRVRKKGPCIAIDFEGDGFLYKMVRLMVGAIAHCALGQSTVDELAARLNSDRSKGRRYVAPAEGLFLLCVRY